MKKFRGQKRYYRKLLNLVKESNLNTTDEDWYDFWHIHVDWYGYGNLGWSHRERHLKILLQLFKKLLDQAVQFNQPYQIWVNIDLKDSHNNTIFVHTKNPNGDNFPFRLNDVDWSIKKPRYYEELVKEEYSFGLLKGIYGPAYLITSRLHGIQI